MVEMKLQKYKLIDSLSFCDTTSLGPKWLRLRLERLVPYAKLYRLLILWFSFSLRVQWSVLYSLYCTCLIWKLSHFFYPPVDDLLLKKHCIINSAIKAKINFGYMLLYHEVILSWNWSAIYELRSVFFFFNSL